MNPHGEMVTLYGWDGNNVIEAIKLIRATQDIMGYPSSLKAAKNAFDWIKEGKPVRFFFSYESEAKLFRFAVKGLGFVTQTPSESIRDFHSFNIY